jgi:ribosome modulation factor
MPLSRPILWLAGPLLVTLLGGCAGLRGGYADLHSALFGPDTDTFCTVENGYQQGLAGANYADICPDRLAPAFLDGYQRGYALHLTEREIDSMERAIEALSGDLSHTWSQLDGARVELRALSSAGEDSSATRARIARLTDKAHTLSTQLDEMEADLASRKQQLLQARHMFATAEP